MSLLEGGGLTAVPEPEEGQDTEYVVLKQVDPGDESENVKANEIWEKVGLARGSRASVLKHVAGLEAGVYLATPSRSWKPARIGVKTETTITEL